MKLLRLSIALACLFLVQAPVWGQNCIPTNINGTTFSISCVQNCVPLDFRIPHLKSTSDYTVIPVPYTPYPYVTATGTEDFALYNDDEYSALFNLPFPFCFYDNIYTSAVVGSNGIVTFDPANASCTNAYIVTQPIPYAGGVPCNLASVYYPQASIMAAYSDLDPSTPASDGSRKIQWEVVGTAPCRKFVISYYHIGVYSAVGGCSLPKNTFQIVAHESTGIIEMFFEQKACISGTNNGRAILGIQNWDRDKWKTLPGHNNAVWNEDHSGYKFIPSAGASRYSISQLYTLAGTLIATADTSTTVQGLLDLHFPNVCAPALNNTFVIKTTFSACENPLVQLVSYDTVYVNKTHLDATSTKTDASCGQPTGTVTITVASPGGVSPYTYTIDANPPVTVPGLTYTFTNLVPGLHTFSVHDAGGCSNAGAITVNTTTNFNANLSASNTSCAGVNNGSITVTPIGGVGPYTFGLDGGPMLPGTVPFTFTNVSSGSHVIKVADVGGCTAGPIDILVNEGAGVSGNLTSTATSCPSVANGTVTADATAGTGPFTYQLDSGTPQSGTNPFTFSNVSPGLHTVIITDISGCSKSLTVDVVAGPLFTTLLIASQATCSGASDGKITIVPQNTNPPYSYSLDGAPFVPGGSPFTFTNVAAGTHTVVTKDGSGCISPNVPIDVPPGPILTTTVNKTDVSCYGGVTGTITVTQPSIGVAPYEYSLNNVNWQISNVFTGLTAGSYTVYYREALGCQNSQPITINEPADLVATVTTVPVICHGENNGTININTIGGTGPYEYSINGGGNWQGSPVFSVIAGPYTVLIRDANGCTKSQSITVTEPAALTANAITTNASCDGGNDGIITISAGGGNTNYQYSIDGTNYQASNIFNVAPGPYTVWVKDNLGCNTSFPITVALTTNLSLTPQTDPTICEGTSTQLQLNSNATVYTWTPSTGLSNTAIANPVANPTAPTQYIVTATLGRCSANDTVFVNVNPAPVPDAGTPGFICYGQTYQLNGSGGTIFSWTPSTYLNTTSVFNPVATPAQTITYTLSVTDALGCHSLVTDNVIIDVTPPIHVTTYPFDTLAHPGDQFQLLATSAAPNYTWSPSTGLSDANIANPVLTVGPIGSDQVYKVTAYTAAGCIGEGFVTLKVYKGPDIYVPTGFTPNNDGKNDKFTPFPVSIKQITYFRIFNRWGQMIFSSSKLHDGWDGKLGGKEQPSGVYVWMVEGITKDGKIIKKSGTVMLIR